MQNLKNIILYLGVICLSSIALMFGLRRRIIARILRLSPPTHRTRVQREIRVPMADGVQLTADHYYPARNGDYPTILIRSPYGRNRHASIFGLVLGFVARRFAERGYHVIVQDVRGRFDSGGQFQPYFNERADGQATVEWLKRQAWFNGRIGMWGSSYLGITQWAVAPGTPEVKAINPTVTGSNLRLILFPDGAFDLGLALRWASILKELEAIRDIPFWRVGDVWGRIEKRIAPAFDSVSLAECDRQAIGDVVDFYQFWLEHAAEDDPIWTQALADLNIGQTTAAAHFVGGWYDFFLRATLQDYETLRCAGKNPYLTIGPWHHFTSIVNRMDIQEGIDWCDAHLKGRTERLRPDPVRVYVMGAGEWRDMAEWPPPAQETAYYLQPEATLQPAPPTADEAFSQYRYDPMNPTPGVGGTVFSPYGAGRRDNRQVESRDDVLTFTTAPFDRPLEVVGYVRLRLYVRSSSAYTDFYGRVCDVQPDGRSLNVCDGLFRITPRTAQADADGLLCIEVDLWATAYRFKRGHRLRLQVASGAHPHWARNFGADDPLRITQAIVAEQTVFHDSARPSVLILPVVSA